MKHKNAEMIIAKVNNTELVVLVKVIDSQNESGSYWTVSSLSALSVAENKFFLCLPQHKKACLHWLNGGKLMIDNGKGLGEGRYTMDIRRNNPLTDFIGHPEYTFRIKPMIEKVWVAYHKDGFMFNEVGGSVSDIDDRVKSHELSDFVGADWQYKEIEVTG